MFDSDIKPTLFYVHDPMCSWCWGYKKTWHTVEQQVSDTFTITYLLGGLAKDSDEPMSIEMQRTIESYWHQVHKVTGAEFNHDFWRKNTPRRSTYPACRAVIVADKFGQMKPMITAIQRAYYLEAKNPSDYDILADCAESCGIDRDAFFEHIDSKITHRILYQHRFFIHTLKDAQFPSLYTMLGTKFTKIPIDYNDPQPTIQLIRSTLQSD